MKTFICVFTFFLAVWASGCAGQTAQTKPTSSPEAGARPTTLRERMARSRADTERARAQAQADAAGPDAAKKKAAVQAYVDGTGANGVSEETHVRIATDRDGTVHKGASQTESCVGTGCTRTEATAEAGAPNPKPAAPGEQQAPAKEEASPKKPYVCTQADTSPRCVRLRKEAAELEAELERLFPRSD